MAREVTEHVGVRIEKKATLCKRSEVVTSELMRPLLPINTPLIDENNRRGNSILITSSTQESVAEYSGILLRITPALFT